jgi:hypothetical protein
MPPSPAVEKVRERLAGNAGVRLAVEADSIRAVPVDGGGFEVGLATRAGRYTVWFAGWHEEFDSEREALDCLAFGLSRRCRLKVLSAGGLDYRWTVEYRRDGGWVEESVTGLLFWPFWKPRAVRYLQYDVIAREETP